MEIEALKLWTFCCEHLIKVLSLFFFFFFGSVWFGVLRVLFNVKMLLFCAEDRAQGCNFVGEAMMMRRARN